MPGNTCEAYRLAEKPVRKRGFLHLWWGKLHSAYMTIATKYYMDTLHHHPIPYHLCMVYLPTFTVVFALIPSCSTLFFQYLVAKSLNQAGKLRTFGCCPIHCYKLLDSGTCSSERFSWHPPKNQRPKESNIRCSVFFSANYCDSQHFAIFIPEVMHNKCIPKESKSEPLRHKKAMCLL